MVFRNSFLQLQHSRDATQGDALMFISKISIVLCGIQSSHIDIPLINDTFFFGLVTRTGDIPQRA